MDDVMFDDMTDFLVTFSTAEDEANLRLGDPTPKAEQLAWGDQLPEGDYRIIDGQLFRIVGGAPLLR